MSDTNDTQAELAAWELLAEARRERDEWKTEAERLENACDKWSESEMFLHLIGDIETSDIINGLLHTAEDHPCCKGTLLAAASLLLEYSKA